MPAVEKVAALVETEVQATVSPEGLSEWFESRFGRTGWIWEPERHHRPDLG
jgi:hypothetical protein